MTFSELITIVNNWDLSANPSFDSEAFIKHAIRWYASFNRKSDTAIFSITSGTQTYNFSSDYNFAVPLLIIDDDGITTFRPYSIFGSSFSGDFYTLPLGDTFTLVFKSTPNRTRNTTLVYNRAINVPNLTSDVIDVPEKHLYVIFYFIEAFSQAQQQLNFVWDGIPINYEAYFLGQTGDQVRRSWARCMAAKEAIQEESAYDGLDVEFVSNWNVMDTVDYNIREQIQR